MVRTASVLLAALLLTTTPGAHAADPDPTTRPSPEGSEAERRAKPHFDAALAHYERGRYREAAAELELALSLDPSGKDLLYNLGLVHERLGELGAALHYLRRARVLETDPAEQQRLDRSLRRIEGAYAASYLSVRVPPRATPARLERRADAWVVSTATVAVGAALIGTMFALRADALEPSGAERSAPPEVLAERERRVTDASAVSALSFLVAVVAGTSSAALYWLRPVPVTSAAGRGAGLVFGGVF
jgi:tetratricopeptide (TPR) repeat protein